MSRVNELELTLKRKGVAAALQARLVRKSVLRLRPRLVVLATLHFIVVIPRRVHTLPIRFVLQMRLLGDEAHDLGRKVAEERGGCDIG